MEYYGKYARGENSVCNGRGSSLEENASVSFMPRLTSYSVSLPRLNTPPAVSDTPQTMSDLPSGACTISM